MTPLCEWQKQTNRNFFNLKKSFQNLLTDLRPLNLLFISFQPRERVPKIDDPWLQADATKVTPPIRAMRRACLHIYPIEILFTLRYPAINLPHFTRHLARNYTLLLFIVTVNGVAFRFLTIDTLVHEKFWALHSAFTAANSLVIFWACQVDQSWTDLRARFTSVDYVASFHGRVQILVAPLDFFLKLT